MSRFQRFSTAAVPVMFLFAGLAHADVGGYEMSAYMDGAGSEEVLAGRYQAAIEAGWAPSASASQEDRLIASTNLCVANTVQSDFPAAQEACGRALKLARAADIAGWMRSGERLKRVLQHRSEVKPADRSRCG